MLRFQFGRSTRASLRLVSTILLVSTLLGVSFVQAAPTTTSSRFSPSAGILFHPIFRHGPDIQSMLYLLNESEFAANYAVTFFSQDGTSIFDMVGSLDSMASTAIESGTVPGMTDGLYSAVVSMDAPLTSVVRTFNATSQTLSLYRGIDAVDSASTLWFGPFFKTAERSSSIHLQNAGVATATIQVEAIQSGGDIADTTSKTVDANLVLTISADDLELPDNFTGVLKVTADQPVVGLLAPTSETRQIGLYPPVGLGSQQRASREAFSINYVPRILSGLVMYGQRDTQIFVGNQTSNLVAVSATAYDSSDSDTVDLSLSTISPDTFQRISSLDYLDPENEIGQSAIASLVISSDGPLWVSELTESVGGYALASYGSGNGNFSSIAVAPSHILPYVSREYDGGLDGKIESLIWIQNAGASDASVTVEFMNPDGSSQHVVSPLLIEANRSKGVALSSHPELGDNFVGSALITSENNISVYVDEFLRIETQPTPTATATSIPTVTLTSTPVPTVTVTATTTATATVTTTATITAPQTPVTPVPSVTGTGTVAPEESVTPSATMTVTVVPTMTPTPTETPTPEPLQVEAITGSGSVTNDPQTGEAAVEMTEGDTSDLTIRYAARCADSSTPTRVALLADWAGDIQSFSMSASDTDLYQGTIPAAAIIESGDLSVKVTCGTQANTVQVGRIQLTRLPIQPWLYLPMVR